MSSSSMEETQKSSDYKAHCLVLPYPNLQGHINPMLQFSKRLYYLGLKVTLVTTLSAYNKFMQKSWSSSNHISLATISDGYDQGGSADAPSVEAYLDSLWTVGAQTLGQLIDKLSSSGHKVDCVIYDSIMPWPLDVAKKFGIFGAAFFTQSCIVNNIFCHVHRGRLKLPLSDDDRTAQILLPGLHPLEPLDLPSFVYDFGSYLPAVAKMILGQFSNVDKADWVLCNSFYELEQEAVDWLAKIFPFKTIGPAIPSDYLDKRLEEDKEYGANLFKPNNDACMRWLDEQVKGSVAYVAFGSAAELGGEQMEELAWGLRRNKGKFLWVVRESEATKLPKGFVEEISEKSLVVSWCPQLEVLAHEAVGCFVAHCGWNSTLEALSLGVPMVGLPQWTDQSTNAKCIMDVWKIGLKAQADEKGVVRKEVVEDCVREIMVGERGKEIKRKTLEWKELARKAVEEGGSSSNNIHEFIAKLVSTKEKRCMT